MPRAGFQVSVEITELRKGLTRKSAEADCAVRLPSGEALELVVRLNSPRAPYWRVATFEVLAGETFWPKLLEWMTEEELCHRISQATALWEIWDAVKAQADARYGE